MKKSTKTADIDTIRSVSTSLDFLKPRRRQAVKKPTAATNEELAEYEQKYWYNNLRKEAVNLLAYPGVTPAYAATVLHNKMRYPVPMTKAIVRILTTPLTAKPIITESKPPLMQSKPKLKRRAS
jgi:hypothetical protein